MSGRWVCNLWLWSCRHDLSWLICLLETLRCYRFNVEIDIILKGVRIRSIPWNRLLGYWLVLGVWLGWCIFSSHECLTCVFDKVIKCTKWFNFHIEFISNCLGSARARNDDPWTITYVRILVLLITWSSDSVAWIMLFNKSRKPIEYSDSLICHLLWHLLSDTNLAVLGCSRSRLSQSYHVHCAMGLLICDHITLVHWTLVV